MINIIILSGLPGSGKSTYAELNYKKAYNNHIFHLDDFLDDKRKVSFKRFNEYLGEHNIYYSGGKENINIIIDGFLPEIIDRIKVINIIMNHVIGSYRNTKLEFSIREIYWNIDREACLNNDRFRINRPLKSENTIRCSAFDGPIPLDTQLSYTKGVYEWRKTKFFYVKKYSKTEAVIDYAINMCSKDNYSYTANCNGNYLYSPWKRAEDFVNYEFDEFDEILEKLDKNMSIFLYKKIKKESGIKVESKEESSDWYGNFYTTYMRYSVDLNKLKEVLKKYNLIDNE